MRRNVLAVSLILAMMAGNCQQLSADDHVPDVEIPNVLNWKSDTFKLSDFKKKLIVLDFWSFTCTACLEAFPEIDSLQKEFNNDVQFIAVNNESLSMTKSFLKNHPRIRFPDIPFVSGDSILSNFFPRVYSPWHIWIDSSKKVRFITDAYNATRKNIKEFLSGETLSFHQLKYNSAYLETSSILGQPELLKYLRSYSYISNCVPEIFGDNTFGETENGFFRLSNNCMSLLGLLQTAFGEYDKHDFRFPTTYEFSEVIPDSIYNYPADQNKMNAWMNDHCYSYVLMLPKSNAEKAFRIMQRDISEYFKINVSIEKKAVKCFALVRISKSKAPGLSNNQFMNEDKERFYYYHKKASDLVYDFNFAFSGHRFNTFVIDKTNYAGKISLVLEKRIFQQAIDIELLNSQLKKYNLKLVPDITLAEVMVVKSEYNTPR